MIYKVLYVLLFIGGFVLSTQAWATDNISNNQGKLPKILLDTDPGGDDIFALLWLQSLVKQGKAEIVAVTTVDGNVRSQYTFAGASKILTLGGFGQVEVGRGVPVHTKDATGFHGADGMGNLSQTLPASKHNFAKARYADDIIIEKLNAMPGEITLIAIGPLTNLAAAEEKSPGILAKAKEIIIMGGAFNQGGNITSHAEFNIHYNPEAAQKVFASRDDIVVLPLDITVKIIFTTDLAKQMSQVNPESQLAQFLVALCEFMTKTNMSYKATQGKNGFIVHDAATLAYLFYPETLLLRRAKIRVETQGKWTRGQTLIDNRHTAKTGANAWVALQVDEINLLAILVEDLKVLINK
jgi:inosine-uridine nucleoside N-ribohydrolase